MAVVTVIITASVQFLEHMIVCINFNVFMIDIAMVLVCMIRSLKFHVLLNNRLL